MPTSSPRRLLAVAPLALALTAVVAAENWPHFQGPRRDGTSSERGLRRSWPESGPPVAWTAGLGPGFGGAAVFDAEVYLLDRIAGEQDVLRCLDLESGRERWRFEYDAPGRLSYAGSRGVPTVTADHVYTIGGFGHVHCIDRSSHEPLWHLRIDERYDAEMPRWGWSQSPLVHGNLVIVAPLGSAVGLCALDAATGREVWRSGPLGDSHSTPTLLELGGREQVLFLTRRGGGGLLSSFAPADGTLLWQSDAYANRIPIPPPIRVNATTLFVTGGYQAGSIGLEVRRDEDQWATRELFRIDKGSQIHLPLLHDGNLYALVNENWNDRRRREEGGLMCLDPGDGSQRWRTGDAPYMGRGAMLLADGMLIIQDGLSGRLRLVAPDPSAFRVLAEANVFGVEDDRDHQMWAPMALSAGRLLMRSQSAMKCVDLRVASAPGDGDAAGGS